MECTTSPQPDNAEKTQSRKFSLKQYLADHNILRLTDKSIIIPFTKQTITIVGICFLVIFLFVFQPISVTFHIPYVQEKENTVTQKSISKRLKNVSKKVFLTRKDNDTEELMHTFPLVQYNEPVVRWNDWIFFADDFSQQQRAIYAHNITTGETHTIHDEIDLYASLQVIDARLFVSVSAYLEDGALYWMDLPPSGKLQKINGAKGGEIVQAYNRYWIVKKDGELCWVQTDFSLLNITSKEITPIFTAMEGCRGGDAFISIDINDRMIFAHHGDSVCTDVPPDTTPYSSRSYFDYVFAVPLSNISTTEEIIAEQHMPPCITSLFYNEKSNQLLLLGTTAQLLNTATNERIFLSDLPETFIDSHVYGWNSNSICIATGKQSAKIDLSSHQFIENDPFCNSIKRATIPFSEEKSEKEIDTYSFLQSLNLPKDYEISVESVVEEK